jgi:hypothetical protein
VLLIRCLGRLLRYTIRVETCTLEGKRFCAGARYTHPAITAAERCLEDVVNLGLRSLAAGTVDRCGGEGADGGVWRGGCTVVCLAEGEHDSALESRPKSVNHPAESDRVTGCVAACRGVGARLHLVSGHPGSLAGVDGFGCEGPGATSTACTS